MQLLQAEWYTPRAWIQTRIPSSHSCSCNSHSHKLESEFQSCKLGAGRSSAYLSSCTCAESASQCSSWPWFCWFGSARKCPTALQRTSSDRSPNAGCSYDDVPGTGLEVVSWFYGEGISGLFGSTRSYLPLRSRSCKPPDRLQLQISPSSTGTESAGMPSIWSEWNPKLRRISFGIRGFALRGLPATFPGIWVRAYSCKCQGQKTSNTRRRLLLRSCISSQRRSRNYLQNYGAPWCSASWGSTLEYLCIGLRCLPTIAKLARSLCKSPDGYHWVCPWFTCDEYPFCQKCS